jgi:hypothetical protein
MGETEFCNKLLRQWRQKFEFSNLIKINCVRFEVLTSGTMKSAIFYDLTPCDLVKIYRLLGKMYCIQLLP